MNSLVSKKKLATSFWTTVPFTFFNLGRVSPDQVVHKSLKKLRKFHGRRNRILIFVSALSKEKGQSIIPPLRSNKSINNFALSKWSKSFVIFQLQTTLLFSSCDNIYWYHYSLEGTNNLWSTKHLLSIRTANSFCFVKPEFGPMFISALSKLKCIVIVHKKWSRKHSLRTAQNRTISERKFRPAAMSLDRQTLLPTALTLDKVHVSLISNHRIEIKTDFNSVNKILKRKQDGGCKDGDHLTSSNGWM